MNQKQLTLIYNNARRIIVRQLDPVGAPSREVWVRCECGCESEASLDAQGNPINCDPDLKCPECGRYGYMEVVNEDN